MIALIATMLRERRFQAVMLALLASLAFAGAIGLPAYLSAVDRAAIVTELNHASRDEQLIEVRDQGTSDVQQSGFGSSVPAALSASSLNVTYAKETDVHVLIRPETTPELQYRQNVCDHVVIEAGRCPVGTGEVMIDAALAGTERARVGSTLPIVYVTFALSPPLPPTIARVPGYDPIAVTVVGIYRPRDATEPYWGDELFFQQSADRGTDAPMFTTAGTFTALHYRAYTEDVTAVLAGSALTPDHLGTVATQVHHDLGLTYPHNTQPISDIPHLLASIAADRAGAREYLPIMAIPLIAIGWLVVYLASAYAMSGRRAEVGVVALRGVRLASRWWAGTGEALVAIVVAIPVGYLLASIAVRLAVRLLIPHHVHVPPIGPGSLPYLAVAFAGCVLATAVAAWRPLRTSPADLLRGVPPRAARWRTAAIEILVVAVAGVLVVQMRGQNGRLIGLDQAAPGLAVAAVAIVAARLIVPLASTIGRGGIRRGRALGASIGALQVARRPGVARLFVLMTIAVGMVTYAAAGAGVARAARSGQAGVDVGSPTVVSVGPVTRIGLLTAVRKADPTGTAAMAVAEIPQATAAEPPILAVDASRLATVAAWPAGHLSALRAATMLRSGTGTSIVVTGDLLSTTITARTSSGHRVLPVVSIFIEPLTGGPAQQAYFTPVARGSQTYTSPVACAAGCRIAGLVVSDPDASGQTVAVTIHPIRVTVPVGPTVAGFTTASRWNPLPDSESSELPQVSGAAGNLTVSVSSSDAGTSAELIPTDATDPVPVLSTRTHPGLAVGAVGADRVALPIRVAAITPALPGLPSGGILMDLRNADGAVPAVEDTAYQPQVWLSATAPPEIMSRLRAAGLTIIGVSRLAETVTYFDGQGTAIAATFALFATAGILLMTIGASILTSSVDRGRRGRELGVLRVQGLPERRVRSAALLAYVGLAAAAAITGLVAGLVSWRLTGSRVPVFPDDHAFAGAPIWPATAGLLWPWLVAGIVLLAVSGAAARDLRLYVRRDPSGQRSGRLR